MAQLPDMKVSVTVSEPLRVGVPEAARILGVSRAQLYKHIKSGAIKAVKDGSRTLFTMTELRRYVAASEAAEDVALDSETTTPA